MSVTNKMKRDMKVLRHLNGDIAKYFFMRNESSVKNRTDKLIDSKIKNDSLLQKIRVKFGFENA